MDAMAVATLDIRLCGNLTEEDARAIIAQGEEAVVFAILELSKRLKRQARLPTRTVTKLQSARVVIGTLIATNLH